jgi:hypothetical protein
MRVAVVNANKGLFSPGRRERLIGWANHTAADLLFLMEPWSSRREPIASLGSLQLLLGNCCAAVYARPHWPCRPLFIEERWLSVSVGGFGLHAVYFPSNHSGAGDRISMLNRLGDSIGPNSSRRHIVTGDFNLAPQPRDGLYNGTVSRWTTDRERAALEELLSKAGLVDSTKNTTRGNRFTFERAVAGLPSQFRCDLALVDKRLGENVSVQVDPAVRKGASAFTDHSGLLIDCDADLKTETIIDEPPRSNASLRRRVATNGLDLQPGNTAIRRGLFRKEYLTAMSKRRTRILDYGCGFGDDVDWLRREGFTTAGFDPCPRRDEFGVSPRGVFDAVLMVYVVNVLPLSQRMAALASAWKFVKPGGTLLVAARPSSLNVEASTRGWRRHADGYISDPRRATFQRGFSSGELCKISTFLNPKQIESLDGTGSAPPYSAVLVVKRSNHSHRPRGQRAYLT